MVLWQKRVPATQCRNIDVQVHNAVPHRGLARTGNV